MREKIEAGEKADVFTSADLGHPLKLERDGRARKAVMFTRNTLCAMAAPGVALSRENFLDKLLSAEVKLGTATPRADPSGDYTWEMFKLADKERPGAYAALDAKARQIFGGAAPQPGQPAPPDPIVEGFRAGTVNVAIAYCTSAAQRRRDLPELQVVEVPAAIRTGPEYGLALLKDADPRAVDLALYILSPEGQATLARHGFNPVGLPAPKR